MSVHAREVAQEATDRGVNWFLWRPVFAGLCTLPDLRTTWTLEDVVLAHAALDAREAIEIISNEEARKQHERRTS